MIDVCSAGGLTTACVFVFAAVVLPRATAKHSPLHHRLPTATLPAGLPTTADVSGVAASAKAAKVARQAGAQVPVSAPKNSRYYRGAVGDTFPAEAGPARYEYSP